jgi:bacillithiol system protein YtxJ
MPVEITPLHSTAELDAALEGSAERPLLIFKHSPRCGTSHFAHEQVRAAAGALSPDDVDLVLVDVVNDRPLSQEIAKRLEVMHQSPQMILVRQGKPLWNASHTRITRDTVVQLVSQHTAQ